MAKTYNRYAIIRYVIDAPIIGISYFAAIGMGTGKTIFRDTADNYLFIFISLVAWYIAAYFSKLYADRRSNKYSEEIIFIIYTLTIFSILLSSISFFLRNFLEYTTGFFVLFIASLFLLLTFTKYLLRKYLHSAIFQGKLFDNLLIVGANEPAMDFYETINKYYYYGYKCVGFLDDQTYKMNGCHYHGGISNLSSVLQTKQVDEVIIALPNTHNKQIQECIQVCDYHRIKARMIPDLQQYTSSISQVNNIGLLPVISVRALPLDKMENKVLKRVLDLAFSLLFFLFIGIWLFPLIAITIKLTSKGPVFFKQERWGLNNKKITCYKFRTMVAESSDMDENGYYRQASKGDPRITKLGAFLRKTNMDELPQFWNVLLSNMSVVGPRPHPTPLNLEVMHTVDNYILRHVIKPGITGWAQVNGCRGETKIEGSMQRRVNFDLYYIHRWTFWLDCQIILQTVINFIRGDQNAY